MAVAKITVPTEQVGAVLFNVSLVREGVAEGEYNDVQDRDLLALDEQLRSALESLFEGRATGASVTADHRALRHVLGACLVDAGDSVDQLSEAANPSLPKILGATEKVDWLAKTIDSLARV